MKRYLFSTLFLLAFVMLPLAAQAQDESAGLNTAQTPTQIVNNPSPSANESAGLNTSQTPQQIINNSAPITNTNTAPVTNTNATCTGGNCQYTVKNPLGANSFCGLVKNLLQAAIAIGIPVAVLFLVYAGFLFVYAQGKPEALQKARQNFLWTVIGIAIFLGAWLLASVISNTVNALGGSQNIISCN